MSEITKRVIALFLCIAVALGIFTNVYADSNVLRITAVEIGSKSETADVETPSISNNQVQGGVVFNAQDDYAEYLFTIENTDEYTYKIDSIEDNNSVDALSITYTHDEKITAGANAHVTMRLAYADLLLNQEAVDISDLQIQIHFTRINEEPVNPDDPSDASEETININPNTNDGVTIFAFGSSIALFVAMFALRNVLPRKLRIAGDSAALILAGSAIGIYAVRAANIEEIDINFSNIHLESKYEEYTVYVDTGNGPVTHQVLYGTPLSDILVRPTKTGYHFEKWTDSNNAEVHESDIVTGPMSITVNMAPNQYRVVFHDNNSTDATTTQTLTYDTAANLAENSFTYAGYNFDGWATSADGNVVYTDGQSVSNLTTGTEDVNLYAKWSKLTNISYVVTHRFQQAVDGDAFDVDNPDDELQGSVDTEYTATLRPRTGFQTPNPEPFTIEADGSTHIYVDYYREIRSLGLNDTEFIETETPAGDYRYGYPISLTAKEREGYNFLGWKSGGNVVSENTTYSFEIKDNVTLTPSYEKKKFTVVVDPNNGTQTTTHNNVEYGTAMSTLLPEQPSKTGHAFVNWTDTDSNVVTGETVVTGALAVTANYQANTYNVVFNANGGTGEMASQSFVYGQSQTLTENSFTYAGYNFDGWATSADGDKVYADKAEVSNLTTGTNNVNLYAKWIKRTDIRYVVRHSYEKLMEDGYTNEDTELQGSIGVDYTPERQPRTGYVTPDAKTEQISAEGDTVIEYIYNLERKNLTLNDTDYIETQTPAGEYKYGYPISLTAKEREGYNFTGWSNGTTVVSEATTYNFNIHDNVTLTPTYAKQRFDVTINYNNSSAQEVKNVEYGTILSTILTEPSKTGYYFTKWVDNNNHDIDTSGTVTSAMTVNAVYGANKYHVVFNANSNSATGNMPSQEFTYSEEKNLSNNAFSRDGYEFDGWATSTDGDVVYTDGQSVSNLTTGTEDVNLYAKWHMITNIHYTVLHRYQEVTGDGYEELTKDYYDGDVERLIEPILMPKTGFRTPEQISDHVASDGSTVFTYTYPREVYHLTLHDAEYITAETPDADYRYGREISLTAQNRESEGYDFLGWNNGSTIVSEDATYSFTITSNVELTPDYAKKKFTVTINPNNGTQTTTHNNVEYGTAMSELLPEQPSKTGHAFVNWADANSNVVTGETTITSALTVTANYQPNTYHVVFNPNGGTGEMGSQAFVYGTSQNLTRNAFSRPGYSFDGWATSTNGEVEYTNGENVSNLTTGTEDVNLYAKWSKLTNISYVVTHRFQQAVDGDVFDVDNPDDELQGSVDTEYTVTLRPRTGFQTPNPEPFTIEADGSTHIYVDYYRETRSLGLNNTEFIENGSTSAGDYRYGYPISLTAVARTGYDFLGWHNGTEIVSANTTYSFDLAENVTLEPRYQIQSYTVTVDKSDGSTPTEYTLDYGTVLAPYLIDPEITGYHIDGWASGGKVVTDESIVEGPMTIEAVIEANKYHVVYNANGGTGTMDSQEMTYDTMGVLAPNIFTRPGYIFDGWATSADGNVVYTDNQDVYNMTTTTDDVNLYAKWHLRTDIPYTVYHRYENVNSGFTQVEVNAQGSIDTDITPETLPEEGFGDPVADANTPIPGQIQLDGSSYFIYNYYRQMHQLTINDYQYVVTDTYSGTYKHGKEITLEATERVAYEFAGWQKVTSGCEAPNCEVLSTESEYAFTLTEDTIIVPVYNAVPFHYVFNHPGQCVFSSEDPISGDDCEYAGEEYIDTGVKLYNEANYNVDYEIGFTIDKFEDEQVHQATLMNAKYEYSSSTSPGIAVRKSGNTSNAEITQSINGSKVEAIFSSPTGTTVRIVRIDGIVYYSINGSNLMRLQASKGTSDYHDITTWFGASYNPNDSVDNPIWRRFNGKLSNMYIKIGAYDVSPTVTVTYNVEDGTVSPTSQRIPVGQTIKDFPIPVSNSGQNFMSWYKYKNGDTWSNPVVENVTTFNEDTTLYARWASTNDACEINGSTKGTLDECVSIAKQTGTSSSPALITILKDLTNVQIDTTTGHYIKIDGRGFNLTSKSNKYILENTGGDITVEDVNMILIANQAAINAKGGTVNVNDVHIAVDNISSCRQGIYLGSDASAVVNVYGGTTIYSECSQRAPIQIDMGTIYIEDAEITAKNYFALDGSRSSTGTGKFVLGKQDGMANTATPVIRSDKANSNAINLGNKTLEFYDGQASSKGAVVNGGTVSATERNAVQQTTPLDSNYSTYNWLYYAIP